VHLRLIILIAVGTTVAAAVARAEDWSSLRPRTVATCRSNCQQQQGVTPALCAQYCECTTAGMETIFSYQTLSTPNHTMTADEQRRMAQMVIACSQRTLGR
jgi:hypothetical protein